MISCLGIETPDEETIQFTSDDLSYLYYDSDTLVFDGNPIEHKESVRFLYNGVDTISTLAETVIDPNYDLFSPDGISPGILGESTLRINDVKGFRYFNVNVTRINYDITNGTNYSNYILFYVGVNDYDIISKKIFLSDSIHLDTVSVLGMHYENVLNLTPDTSTQSMVKNILFAKKFGFIKIETYDGKKLERLLP